MSSDVFILPAQPQIPVSGLNGTDTKGSAAFKSNPLRGIIRSKQEVFGNGKPDFRSSIRQ